MRALRSDGLSDVAMPNAGDEVLVRVTLSGICNTDLELARGYMDFHGTLGHEFVGVLEDGTRVVGEINAGCGVCALCATGDARHCPMRTVLGILGRDGAHADYLTLPARNLIPVPDQLSDLAAVFVEPLAAACGVLERCEIAPSMRVAVIGDGKLGLLCAFVLHARGFAPVLVGKHPDKLALAKHVTTTTETPPREFDVVIEASGNASGLQRALEMVKPLGTIVLKSTFHGATPIDASRVVVDEIRIVGSRCGRFAPALELLPALDLSPLVSEVISLDDADRAMRAAATPGVMKVLLRR